MSDPKPTPTITMAPWVGGSVLTLLVLQLGMLWLQGTMLQRQHEDLLGLREDVEALAESLDQGDDAWNSAEEGLPSPARQRVPRRRAPRVTRAAFLQNPPDEDAAVKKDLDDTKKSATEAVAKARDTRDKLSITENIRKADEKAKVEAQGRTWRPWLWAGAGLALLAMVARSWLRRRG